MIKFYCDICGKEIEDILKKYCGDKCLAIRLVTKDMFGIEEGAICIECAKVGLDKWPSERMTEAKGEAH